MKILTRAVMTSTVILGGILFGPAAAAHASETTCDTLTSGSYVCEDVQGSGTHIDYQMGQVKLISGQVLCDFHLNFVYTDSTGYIYSTNEGPRQTGCVRASAGLTAGQMESVYERYTGASDVVPGQACAAVFTNDNYFMGSTCIGIHN